MCFQFLTDVRKKGIKRRMELPALLLLAYNFDAGGNTVIGKRVKVAINDMTHSAMPQFTSSAGVCIQQMVWLVYFIIIVILRLVYSIV